MLASKSGRPEPERGWSTVEEHNYQRRGEQGDTYDEYGAEMEPNAKIWEVYVDEVDKADKELVDGWNSIRMYRTLSAAASPAKQYLSQAALYSAILTAFVIESSKELRPDYSEISAQALVIISKTLLSPETASPSAQPGLQANLPDFVPTTAAVMVNTLWFLSLGLSIAVSLIAILAKEWCYSFMTRRTGAKLVQGRLRQKRWDGIKYWKMEEIICMLPLLMHIALLLFAIGLSIYLWNINPKVSLPVVVTTVLTVLYYTVTAFLPLFSKYCPYTTAVVKLFHPLWTAIFKSIYSKALFQMLVMAPAWLILHILDFKDRISGKSRVGDENLESGSNISSGIKSEKTLRDYVQEFEKKFYHRIERMHKDFLIDRFQPGEDETPMDEATSSMLLWMIMNCENPKSVDLALRALAGADLWLPCKIFLHHEIDFHILRKLERCLYVLESPHLKSQERRREELIDDTYLYARALATLLRGAPEKSKTHCVPWNDWVNCMRRIHNLKINDATHPRGTRSRTSRSTDLEFGTLLLEGNPAMHLPVLEELHPGQRERRWEILKQITTAKITIPPSIASVRGLVNVVTGTLLHTPRSPLPLVRLFNAYNINMGNEDATLGHAIGIALTVARFTDPRLAPIPGIQEDLSPSREATSASSSAPVSRLEHAQKVYQKLIVKQPTQRRTRALLTFGLLGLLDYPHITGDRTVHAEDKKQPTYLKEEEIQSVEKALHSLETPQRHPRESTLLMHEDRHFRYLGYHKLMPLTPPTFDLEAQFEPMVMKWLGFWVGPSRSGVESNPPDQDTVAMHLEALLSPSRCRLFGSLIIDELITLILASTEQTNRVNSKRLSPKGISLGRRAISLCIRSIAYSVTDWPSCSNRQRRELQIVINKLIGAGIHTEMISLISDKADETKDADENLHLVPYAMRFLWNFTSTLIRNFHPREGGTLLAQTYGQVAVHMHSHLSQPYQTWISVRDVGFEVKWFRILQKLCNADPANVLKSGVLGELADVRSDERSRVTNHGPTFSARDMQFLGLSASSDRDELQGTWPEIYERLQEKCEASVPTTKLLSIEVKGAQTNENEPTVASPRSEPEQPFGITEINPAVQGSSTS